MLGEPLAVCWVIVRGVERLEDASPDAIGSPQTLVEDSCDKIMRLPGHILGIFMTLIAYSSVNTS